MAIADELTLSTRSIHPKAELEQLSFQRTWTWDTKTLRHLRWGQASTRMSGGLRMLKGAIYPQFIIQRSMKQRELQKLGLLFQRTTEALP